MRVAVIGVGRMGRRHLEVIDQLGLELAGILDANEEALTEAGVEHDVPLERRFHDVDELAATKPDCVIIATTASAHAEYVLWAARAGARFVLCEKPMATSLRDCDRMIEACGSRGTRLAVNHQMRFMPQYTEPKRIVESPAFGGLSSVTVVAGNLGLAMNGTHYFEMFRYMTGEPPAWATAWFDPHPVPSPRGPSFEDRAGTVRLTTDSGHRFYLDASADQGNGVVVVYAGPFGQLIVDELAGSLEWLVRAPEHRGLPTTRYGMPSARHSSNVAPADSVAPTRAVLEALLTDGDVPSGEDGRLAVATLVAAYASDEAGHVSIPIDAALPLERKFPWA